MFEIKGKHNTAKVFTDIIENSTISHITSFLNLEYLKDNKVRIMPDCLTDDTEILTSKGYKKIVNISLDDYIATYNPVNRKVDYSNPLDIIVRKRRNDEIIYEYYNNFQKSGYAVSEKHRMAVFNNMGKEAWSIERFKMNEAVFNADGLNNNSGLQLTDDQIRLIAWIVGDGSLDLKNTRIKLSVKKKRKVNRIQELLLNLNINFHEYSTDKQTTFTIRKASAEFYINYLNSIKEFPQNFLYMNKEQAKLFIDEFIQVDGDYESYMNNGSYSFNSKNKNNLDILQAIIECNLGYAVLKHRYLESNLGIENHNMYYLRYIPYERVQFSKSGTHNRIFERKEIKYDGKLVCIKCNTGYFLARQKGLSFITGNCHDGKGCVIGTTMTITDKAIPSVIGCDVGCGVLVVKLKEKKIELPKLDSVIRKNVAIERTTEHKNLSLVSLDDLRCKKGEVKPVRLGFGTPGGGNHFIEIDKDEETGDLYLVIHSGSRNLGIQIEKYYQDLAYEETKARELGGTYKELSDELIAKLKSEGRKKDINTEISKLKKKFKEYTTHVAYELSYVSGDNFKDYIHDMRIAQRYATLNRRTMADIILKEMKLHEVDSFETVHNYIDIDNMIGRKGAVSAQAGEKLIIPINMRDGSLICIGKGNEDWNYSAPHGAGRLMSRSVAKNSLSVSEFKETMKEAGVFSTCVGKGTIDESPMAYKDMQDIIDNIEDTVDIIKVIKPIYNFKSGEEE